MTLEYSIDDGDFRRLVDEAMRRIPTASRGNWTLHAPVDPGITLVELFAWLLEQRSYWADQTTAHLVRPLLALLGDELRHARPARTVLTFDPKPDRATDTTPLFPHAAIPARTLYRVPETDIEFTLRHGITALAMKHYSAASGSPPLIILAGDVEAGSEEDLRSGRPVELLPAHGKSAEVHIGLVLAKPPPGRAPLPLSILFELETTVAPQWDAEAAVVQPPAALVWESQDRRLVSTDPLTWTTLVGLRDGTLGLRRSGVVRFEVPASWTDLDGVAWIRIRTEKATFTAPPTALRIAPNSALAWHHQWVVFTEKPNWLPLPGRTVQLPAKPLPIADQMYVRVVEPTGSKRWRVVHDFANAGSADRVAIVDRARARVVFGDGLNGKLPRLAPNAAPQVTVIYGAGGGEAGNVPPVRWEALDGPLAEALSLVPARDGRDEETIDDARSRVAADLGRPTRAVTPHDHEHIACSTPGVAVARAYAEVGLDPGECGVVPGVTTVFVVPGIKSRTREQVRAGQAVEAPVSDPGLLVAVRAHFERKRLVGERIVVETAKYVHVRLRARVTGTPHDREGLRARLAGALREYLDPLIGGDDHEGWPFGAPVRPTALLGVAQHEVSNRGDVVEVAVARRDGAFESCEDLTVRPYELVAVDAIEVILDPTPMTAEVGLR